MKTVYLDNNILGQQQNWPYLTTFLASRPEIRVVVSEWNLVELLSISARNQAFTRATFIDNLMPIWMRGYLPIQKLEVNRFTRRQYFCTNAEDFCAFSNHLSLIWADHIGYKTRIGMNARTCVMQMYNDRLISSEKRRIIPVLKTLQSVTSQQKRDIEPTLFIRWLIPRISNTAPSGILLKISEKIEIARYCYNNRSDFYAQCPAMAVEHEVSKHRSRDPRRNPRASDAIDLFHGVLGLSCCDFYVTQDRYARHCAVSAKKALHSLKTANVYSSISELAKQV